jgi:cytochrome c556
MKHPLLSLTATVCCLSTALPAAAQFQKPEDAIQYRQSAKTLMGAHFGRVAAMASGRAPYDAEAAKRNTAVLTTLVQLPFDAYLPGTDTGAPTRAKPTAWTDAAGFKKYSTALQDAVAKLDAAAKGGGGADALKGPVGEIGRTCKGCHDDYRNENYSR